MEFPNLSESTPPVKDATTPNPTPHTNDLKREHESVDDFEHLEISPSKEKSNHPDPSQFSFGADKDLPAPFNVCPQPNLFNTSKDFLKDMTSEKNSASVGSEVSKFLEAETGIFKKPETADHSDLSKFSVDNTTISGVKDASKKNSQPDFGNFKHNDALDHDFLSEPSYEGNSNKQIIDVTPDKSPSKSVTPEPPTKSVTPEPPSKSVTPEPPAHFNPIVKEEPKPDPFESMTEKFTASQPEPKVPSVPITQPKPDPIVKDVPVSTILGGVPKTTSDSIKSTPDKKADSTADFVTKEKTPVKVPEQPSRNKSDDDSELIQVDEVFRRIGLDSWFKPETLHPQVEALVYWRDPKKSGVVFGTILVALLSLTYYSFISVVAYFSLVILCGTISFKVYKSILQAVQKTSDGHPFKEILELELTLPQEKVRAVTDVGVAHFNAAIIELRRLFLVEDLVDSIKFAVLLWLLTRVGAWFNGMTLIIIAFIALFSVPKIYENNKAQVDANLAIVQSKLQEITAKVKAALPIGKKEAEKDKEQ